MLPPRRLRFFVGSLAVLLSLRQHCACAFIATGIARPIVNRDPSNHRPLRIQPKQGDGVEFWKASNKPAQALFFRLGTWRNGRSLAKSSKESPVHPDGNIGSILLQANLGFLGHTGLLLASTVLVLLMQQLFRTIQQFRKGQEVQDTTSGGIMSRCPWPFIFTHDPIQGIKDPPTWILLTWIALWRIIKMTLGKV
jgi:hypothetical protein